MYQMYGYNADSEGFNRYYAMELVLSFSFTTKYHQ